MAVLSPPSMSDVPDIPEYLHNLNGPQLEGATHFEGPILILAGAGSGKTRVLTRRIVHLIKHHRVDPQSILAVTFTNKATKEMRERLESELGTEAKKLWVSTFHAMALRILRRHAKVLSYENDFVVYDAQDSKTLIKRLMKELKIDEGKYSVAQFSKAMERAKNNLISPEQYAADASLPKERVIAEVYDRYQRELKLANAMDFGDLLYNSVRLFMEDEEILRRYQHHLRFLLIDEFQDTNKVQYTLIRLLSAPQENLFVVGDDDQSIYAFRGATIENILNFERDFPETVVVKLEQNYRSTPYILEGSNAVIARNGERKEKQLWTAEQSGQKIQHYVGYNEGDEARFIAEEMSKLKASGVSYSDIALFYRTNAQSRAVEEALMKHRIPYRIYGGLKFYDRKEIKDILAYLKLVANPNDNQSFLRIVNNPPRGIGAKTVTELVQAANQAEMAFLPFLDRFSQAEKGGIKNKGLKAFLEMMKEFKKASTDIPLYELIQMIFERSGYQKRLEEQKAKDISVQSQLENIGELRNIAAALSFEQDSREADLMTFLDRVSLTSSEELPVQEEKDKEIEEIPETVSLMTLHLAKGLEFPVVFFSGLEEGLLPHYHSMDEASQVAEERRLCYVGMTRAMKTLYITRAESRGMFSAAGSFGLGSGGFREPSRFLFDVPQHCFEDDVSPTTSNRNRYEKDVELFEQSLDSSFSQSKPPRAKLSNKTKKMAALSLMSADEHLASTPMYEEYTNAPRADVTDLEPGIRVIHKTFGPGVVEILTPPARGDQDRSKVTIKFDNFEMPKKLVFKQAKLALELN